MVNHGAETAAVVRYANDQILAAHRGAMACRQVSSPGSATTATVRSGSMPRW
jgi:hypothetical protein